MTRLWLWNKRMYTRTLYEHILLIIYRYKSVRSSEIYSIMNRRRKSLSSKEIINTWKTLLMGHTYDKQEAWTMVQTDLSWWYRGGEGKRSITGMLPAPITFIAGTGCSLNIVFFSEFLQIFRTLAILCFP